MSNFNLECFCFGGTFCPFREKPRGTFCSESTPNLEITGNKCPPVYVINTTTKITAELNRFLGVLFAQICPKSTPKNKDPPRAAIQGGCRPREKGVNSCKINSRRFYGMFRGTVLCLSSVRLAFLDLQQQESQRSPFDGVSATIMISAAGIVRRCARQPPYENRLHKARSGFYSYVEKQNEPANIAANGISYPGLLRDRPQEHRYIAVSYTHLTLPTKA